jgi:hypothetical protein
VRTFCGFWGCGREERCFPHLHRMARVTYMSRSYIQNFISTIKSVWIQVSWMSKDLGCEQVHG